MPAAHADGMGGGEEMEFLNFSDASRGGLAAQAGRDGFKPPSKVCAGRRRARARRPRRARRRPSLTRSCCFGSPPRAGRSALGRRPQTGTQRSRTRTATFMRGTTRAACGTARASCGLPTAVSTVASGDSTWCLPRCPASHAPITLRPRGRPRLRMPRAPSPAHAAPARRLLTAERDATCSRTDRVRRSEQTARRTRGSITKDNGTGRAWRPQCMETSTAESGARASVTARSDAASSPAVRGSVARRRVHRRKSVA